MERYRHKLITPDLLLNTVGRRPRKNTVILCHGVFDIVHPGHIRHLMYAKDNADVLVASVTSDRFIDKGVYRPHVPQTLRALNLAAFEFVDYVVIDDHERPDELLKFLQPDYYAKGFEYSATVRGANTIRETDIVRAYGGELIFTPGDVVYSSSRLLDAELPDLRYEKLQTIMLHAGLSFDTLRSVVEDIHKVHALVAGDTIIDSYTYCSMIGGQTKTPTISARFESQRKFVGGAGVVARHMAAAGATTTFVTVLGNDDDAMLAVQTLEGDGIHLVPVVDQSRPTTNKNAIVVDGYRVLKVDTLDNRSISDPIAEKLHACIADNAVDDGVVVFADFRHGMFNARTIPYLVGAMRQGCYKVADSQVASRWGNITEFKGFDLITPNEREARFALADQDSGIRPLASQLYDEAQCKVLMLKLGARGVLTCIDGDHDNLDSFFTIDSFADEVVDPVGAGDAFLAYASLVMRSTNNPFIATILGTFAAALECGYEGNVPVTVEAVVDKISRIEESM